MAYQKKTWLARLGQGLNKFIFNGGSKVTLDSSPDVVTQEGTPLSAENMNDLEQRIDDEFTNVNESITSLNTLCTLSTATITSVQEAKITSGQFELYKFGKLCILNVTVILNTSFSSDYAVTTIPDGFKPNAFYTGYASSGSNVFNLYVNSAGVITIGARGGSYSAGTWIYGSIVYAVA